MKQRRLSDADVWQVIFNATGGSTVPADDNRPAEVPAVLNVFVRRVDSEEPLGREWAQYFAGAFRKYLAGERSLEAAFGLTRSRRGRPNLV